MDQGAKRARVTPKLVGLDFRLAPDTIRLIATFLSTDDHRQLLVSSPEFKRLLLAEQFRPTPEQKLPPPTVAQYRAAGLSCCPHVVISRACLFRLTHSTWPLFYNPNIQSLTIMDWKSPSGQHHHGSAPKFADQLFQPFLRPPLLQLSLQTQLQQVIIANPSFKTLRIVRNHQCLSWDHKEHCSNIFLQARLVTDEPANVQRTLIWLGEGTRMFEGPLGYNQGMWHRVEVDTWQGLNHEDYTRLNCRELVLHKVNKFMFDWIPRCVQTLVVHDLESDLHLNLLPGVTSLEVTDSYSVRLTVNCLRLRQSALTKFRFHGTFRMPTGAGPMLKASEMLRVMQALVKKLRAVKNPDQLLVQIEWIYTTCCVDPLHEWRVFAPGSYISLVNHESLATVTLPLCPATTDGKVQECEVRAV